MDLIRRGFGDSSTDPRAVADCQQLLRVAKRLLGYFYRRFNECDISPGKYSVLCELLALEDSQAVTPSILAAHIGVSRPTVTGLIDGLVRQGYVARRTDADDRRSVTLTLTDSGRDFIGSLLPRQFGTMAGLVETLGPERRRQLRAILEILEARLS